MSSFFKDLDMLLKIAVGLCVSYLAEVEFEFTTWAWVQATVRMVISSGSHCWLPFRQWLFSYYSFAYINKQSKTELATAGMKIGSGLQWNWGCELKLYLGCTGSMGFLSILFPSLVHWKFTELLLIIKNKKNIRVGYKTNFKSHMLNNQELFLEIEFSIKYE